jgi:hypothetical protein
VHCFPDASNPELFVAERTHRTILKINETKLQGTFVRVADGSSSPRTFLLMKAGAIPQKELPSASSREAREG